jgi:hypothetical protein
MLADKVYPELEHRAREQLALINFISLIENPQVAFGVKKNVQRP